MKLALFFSDSRRRLVFTFLIVAGIVTHIAVGPHLIPAAEPSQSRIRLLAEEIGSVGDFYRSPEIDPSGQVLACTRSMNGGRGILLLNINNGVTQQLSLTNEVIQLYGFSPDGRFLAFSTRSNLMEQLCIYDRNHVSLRICPVAPGKSAIWTGPDEFCINYGTPFLDLVRVTPDHMVVSKVDAKWPALSMTSMFTHTVGLLNNDHIWTLNVKTGVRNEIISFAGSVLADDFKLPPNWLNYNRENNAFIFCAWNSADFRHLYLVDQQEGSWELKQISLDAEMVYNGKWTENGKGHAFIGSKTNHFYLGIRSADPERNADLFLGGHVQGYSISPDSWKIYAIGALHSEPPSIWEYNITNGVLREIFTNAESFVSAGVLPRVEQWASSIDGLKIPYYWLPPKNFSPAAKYPAIIEVPVANSQNYPAWEMFSQFFSDVGAFHVAVNYRGCDGFGRSYQSQDLEKADEDIYSVYRDIARNPHIDGRKVFLMSFSGGCHIVNRLLERHPGYWAGVIDLSGPPPPQDLLARQKMKIFLFVGKMDAVQNQDELLETGQWAKMNNVNVVTMYPEHTGHIITDIRVNKDLLFALGKFVYEP